MAFWLTIALGVGIFVFLITVIKRRTSSVTTLHIDHDPQVVQRDEKGPHVARGVDVWGRQGDER